MKVLKVKCLDQPGIISKISTVLYEKKINIIKLDEYVDPSSKYFFFRAEIEGNESNVQILDEITRVLDQSAVINLVEPRKKKVIVLATKEPHCLGDLLLRDKAESLNIEIQGVIANHNTLQDLTQKFDIPFHHIDHKQMSREEHASEMMKQIDAYNPDYIILAKYMRFLPAKFVDRYKNKVINIHHSFLPAFVGAGPYEQAYKRGVKIIGATSHFVTIDLDEGPIVEQDVLHIDHSYDVRELSALGKDVEQLVLSRAIKYISEDRVFVHENKTIVFK